MNHYRAKKRLPLLVQDDLFPEEQKRVEEHVQKCAGCRSEVESLRKLATLIQDSRASDVDDDLLIEARLQFRTALRREQARDTGFTFQWPELLQLPRLRPALAGIAVLAAGVFLGRTFFNTPSIREAEGGIQTASRDARITNIKFVETGNDQEMVEFTYDMITPTRIKGAADDPAIQRILAHAMLNEENPGVRLRAVNAITTPQHQPTDREVKAALIIALKSDRNAAVRKEALTALLRYSFDDEIKDAMINTLMYDRNPGLRVAAINGLDSLRISGHLENKDLHTVLTQKMQTDDNNYIRLRAKAVLQEAREQ